MNRKKILITAAGVLLGGVAGYAYYYFIGCKNGCPIQSNALYTTLYGAFTGFVMTFSFKKDKPEKQKEQE
ncbi:hypothetical protein MASR1M107_31640 [Ignavibacteriales bacterium]